MFVQTHAMMPVLAATVINICYITKMRFKPFSGSDLLFIGFCGASPDLFSPHLQLAARMSSWTHTLWYILGTFPLIMLFCLWVRKLGWFRLTLISWSAIVLHLLCDAVSGGIAPYYPWNTQTLGMYYIPPNLWLPLDIFVLTLALAGMRIVKIMERKFI